MKITTCVIITIFSFIFFLCSNEYTYMAKGSKYYKNGEFRKAEHAYLNAIKCNPNFPSAYLQLGVCYQFGSNEIDKAIVAYQKGLEIDSTDFGLHLNLMQAYFMADRIDKGLSQYKYMAKHNFEKYEFSMPKKILHSMLYNLKYDDRLDLLSQFMRTNSTDATVAEVLITTKFKNLSPPLKKILEDIQYDPKDRKYMDASLYFILGLGNYEVNQIDESLRFFKISKEEGYPVPDEIFNLFQ